MTLGFTPMADGYVTVAIEGPEEAVMDTVDEFLMSTDSNLLSSVAYDDVFEADEHIKRASFLLRLAASAHRTTAKINKS